MTSNRRFEFDWLDPVHRDTKYWATVERTMLKERALAKFDASAGAVQAFLAGVPLTEIQKTYGLLPQHILRHLKRCVETHPDGRIWGFRALIPFRRLKKYERKKAIARRTLDAKGGCSGALQQLFTDKPSIQETVDALFLKRPMPELVHESRIPLRSIHKRFIEECRKVRSTEQWPFCVKNLGITALWRYLKKLETSQRSAVRARYGKIAARKLDSDSTPGSTTEITYPLQRVQLDGHRIDKISTIDVPSPYGGIVQRLLERFWILVIIDVLSRAILGYCLSLRREYNSNDVLRCIKNAIVPWEEKKLTIPGLRYSPAGGLPSGVIPKLRYALWDELLYDNAKANLADRSRQKLTLVVGCGVNAGQIDNPDRRSIIERFYKTLEENLYHRLPSTTGSSPTDPRRQDPEKAAASLHITLEHMQELTDVAIAQYNGTPHSGIGGRTPLEYLRYFTDRDDFLVRTLSENQQSSLTLLNFSVARVVRGNLKKGTAPYVEFAGVRYRSDILVRTPELIGTRVDLSVTPDDCRSIVAYLPDGSEFGSLIAHGFWGRTPHTMEMREAILTLKNKRLIFYTEEQDPVHVYMDHLAKDKHKRSANRLAEAGQVLANTPGPIATAQNVSGSTKSDEVTPAPPSKQKPNGTTRRDALPPIIKKTITY